MPKTKAPPKIDYESLPIAELSKLMIEDPDIKMSDLKRIEVAKFRMSALNGPIEQHGSLTARQMNMGKPDALLEDSDTEMAP